MSINMQGGSAGARALLEVSDSATASDIRAAFRAKVKVAHPDHGGADTIDVAALSSARDLLLHLLAPEQDPAPVAPVARVAPDAATRPGDEGPPSPTDRSGRRRSDPARAGGSCGTPRARGREARHAGWRIGVYRVEPRTRASSSLDIRA